MLTGSVRTMELHARERLGIEGWTVVRWERFNHRIPLAQQVTRLDGGVYPAISKGKNAGSPNYRRPHPGTRQTLYLTLCEHSEWLESWERRTGRCYVCMDHPGKEYRGWSSVEGSRYETCSRCGGSSKSPLGAPEGAP